MEDSLIVVERYGSRYTTIRYSVNSIGKVSGKTLFQVTQYRSVEDMYVFDDHALAHIASDSIQTIYFRNSLGAGVPSNQILKLDIDGVVEDFYVTRSITDDSEELFVVLANEEDDSVALFRYKLFVNAPTR